MDYSDEQKAIMDALRYFADLNGAEWIKGDHPSEVDMRQRANSMQRRLSRIINSWGE